MGLISVLANTFERTNDVEGFKDVWYKDSSSTSKEYDLVKLDQPIYKTGDSYHSGTIENNSQIVEKGFLPREKDENGNLNGSWAGEPGNSTWEPNREKIPDPMNKKSGNPDGLTWGEILDKYEIEGVTFKDGEPDFSNVMKDEVKIDDFTIDRRVNFNKADTALAEKWDVSPREVADWRRENNYTWHECKDCKTMQLVPGEVHHNIPHEGGIAAKKRELNK
ncbi:HNH endonuclease [Acinetobacter bereziniae]|uniref:HNH endonuclease n=1 Tax=Acinetobacter junii TaxID=40215 RepID=A0AAX1MEK7_ACIJU|nr:MULTISPECIES: HNH endonuclease [Acinetobacter]MCT8088772.1 HNH endonuclease [Acinetobacter sp. F_3_1]MCT8096928.1 HNH endonuclease [Acinetobacter sp. C_3_1]MCT8100079.1 HNH endonuclease [Acinetobacter sp. C_4_1]MCT8134476.1 HNH endonuclease [Acinetobacter sp. T_3_1]QUY35421.1 HNH endonuclease [Acinetobacter junii]